MYVYKWPRGLWGRNSVQWWLAQLTNLLLIATRAKTWIAGDKEKLKKIKWTLSLQEEFRRAQVEVHRLSRVHTDWLFRAIAELRGKIRLNIIFVIASLKWQSFFVHLSMTRNSSTDNLRLIAHRSGSGMHSPFYIFAVSTSAFMLLERKKHKRI